MFRPILANNEIYHIINRSIDQTPIFTNKRELHRAYLTLDYYRFVDTKLRLSKLLQLQKAVREDVFDDMKLINKKKVEIISYCFMPNHFHFLVKQLVDDGIRTFIRNFENSYTRYLNIKHVRKGPLFQGAFKSIRIENDNQLLHVNRYIHLNPVVAYLTSEDNLANYEWSSYPEYINTTSNSICSNNIILNNFKSIKEYKAFLFDHIDYAHKLESIKHLALDC